MMILRRAIVSLTAVLGLAACSDQETIVALNVTASDDVPVVDTLRVTITQGSRQHVVDFAPPTEMPTAAEGKDPPPASIRNSFYERITMPGDWSESTARIAVEALQGDGQPLVPAFSDETTALLRPDAVVAAYVRLELPADPKPPSGGVGGVGGMGGHGGTAGAGSGGENLGGTAGAGSGS